MAYSFVVYRGDGATYQFAVPFPYLEQDHVKVYVDGVSYVRSFINPGVVQLGAEPPDGSEVRIVRDSSRDARLSDYQDAQLLTQADLDYDARQCFYVAQEAFDAAATVVSGGDMKRSLNLSDVYNTAEAVDNIHAVYKGGDTMAGHLQTPPDTSWPADDTWPLYAYVNRYYVDTKIAAVGTGTFLPKAGGTMTGYLTLYGAPTADLHAATKAYVDAAVAGGGGGGTDIRPLNNTFTGWNLFNKSVALDVPSLAIKSEAAGTITNDTFLWANSGYNALQIKRSSSITTESSVGEGNNGLSVQFLVSGNTTGGSTQNAVRGYLETSQTRTGSVQNGAVGGHFAVKSTGVNVSSAGMQGEIDHGGTGVYTDSYGTSGVVYRRTSEGFTAAMAARVYGGAGYLNNDAGLAVVPFGDPAVAYALAGISIGTAFHGNMRCSYGIDLRYASPVLSAIALKENQKFSWGGSGSSEVTQRYDWTAGLMSFERAGYAHVGFNMAGSAKGRIYSWDGVNGSYGSYWIDLGGGNTSDAVMSIRGGGVRIADGSGTPTDTQGWIRIYVDGVIRYIPFYS